MGIINDLLEYYGGLSKSKKYVGITEILFLDKIYNLSKVVYTQIRKLKLAFLLVKLIF